ncbi:MAG: HYR domain-containing protein, partial [Candidatus Cloacimonetes bacterium]|nr:HYR domain-containing protein [Candidatus Cloacimonadota bacterium]
SGSIFPIGKTTVTYEVADASNNKTQCSFDVTVSGVAPSIVCPSNITQNNDAGVCGANVTFTATETVGIPASTITYSHTPGSFFPIGTTIVTATATNAVGISSCTFDVLVEDTEVPVVVTQNLTVQLDASGNVSITTIQVDNGSYDACGIKSKSVSPSSFSCSNVGANTVTLTVTDVNGNVSSKAATVIVKDNVAPLAIAKNITIQLDATGNASIIPADVDNGSNDACGIASQTVAPNTFDCSNLGANTVTLTVTDVNNNTSTTTATMTVEDMVVPDMITQNITIQLDVYGDASIVASQIDNGSSDACGIASYGLSKYDFDCSNVGANTVTLTVTDNNGNANTANATVTVQDNIAAEVLTQNITVQLDASGNTSIIADDVDYGSNDACGIQSLSVIPNAFSCSDVGDIIVKLTVIDVNGNVSSETAIVTVEDNVVPIAITKDIPIYLDQFGLASIIPEDVDNGSNDACGIDVLVVSPNTFTCSNSGGNTVTLKVTDNHGNISSKSAEVTVLDKISPTFSYTEHNHCANPSTANSYKVLGSEFDITDIWDNCSYTVTNDATNSNTLAGHVFPKDETIVKWTVTDPSGNFTTHSQTITIHELPIASITATGAEEWCNGVSLTAHTSTSEHSYLWSNKNWDETEYKTTQEIVLQTATSKPGYYNVKVTDQNDCHSEFPAIYQYEPEKRISSYTIIGFDEVDLGEDHVVNGSVGVTDAKGEAKIGKGSKINSTGSFVKAYKIKDHKTSVIGSKITSAASVTLPTMYYNTTAANAVFSKVKVKKNKEVSLSCNYCSVDIDEGSIVTLTGSVFGDIKLAKDASVIFTESDIEINKLEVQSSKKNGMSYILFSTNSTVKIADKLDIHENCVVNDNGYKVIFYMGSSKKKGDVHLHSDLIFNGSIYAPKGSLQLTGGSKSSAVMQGFYIADKVKANAHNVTWNWYDCWDNSTTGSPRIVDNEITVEEGVMSLKAYPNPFTGMANIEFSVPNEGKVVLEVYNMMGQKVAKLFDGNVESGAVYTEVFTPQNLTSGIYFVKLTGGAENLFERIMLID